MTLADFPFGRCKVHGMTRLLPPPKNVEASFCARCAAANIERNRESFLLTEAFRIALAEAAAEGSFSDQNALLRRRAVEIGPSRLGRSQTDARLAFAQSPPLSRRGSARRENRGFGAKCSCW